MQAIRGLSVWHESQTAGKTDVELIIKEIKRA